MVNTITGLIPVMYRALDMVAREMVGFIPAVTIDASADQVAKDQTVRVPVVPYDSSLDDITPAAAAAEASGVTIGYTDMTISKFKKKDIGWNGEQIKTYSANGTYEDTLAKQFAQAVRALTNGVEADIAALAAGASRAYGTANTNPFATAADMTDFAQIRKILEDNGAPTSDLHLVLNSGAIANLRGKMSNLFKVSEAGTDGVLRTGQLFDINGMAIHSSAYVTSPAVGTASGATSNTAGYAIGATSITLAAAGTGTILAGDVITFNGDTNKYVVATGCGAVSGATIVLAAPGLRQALPASAQAITVIARSAQNMAFHRGAITLLARQPAMPDGGDSADDVTSITDPISGLTFQVAKYRQYREVKYEVGLAWGVKMLKPEFSAILLGAY
jgi:hypothetical protein